MFTKSLFVKKRFQDSVKQTGACIMQPSKRLRNRNIFHWTFYATYVKLAAASSAARGGVQCGPPPKPGDWITERSSRTRDHFCFFYIDSRPPPVGCTGWSAPPLRIILMVWPTFDRSGQYLARTPWCMHMRPKHSSLYYSQSKDETSTPVHRQLLD